MFYLQSRNEYNQYHNKDTCHFNYSLTIDDTNLSMILALSYDQKYLLNKFEKNFSLLLILISIIDPKNH